MKDSVLIAVGFVTFLAIVFVATKLLMAGVIGAAWFFVLIALSLVAMLLPYSKIKGPSATVSDGRLIIDAPFVRRDIPLHSIQAVEYRESFTPGWCLWGYGGLKRGYGYFTDMTSGIFTFAGDTSLNGYVVVRHGGGKVVVFNLPDIGETRRIYEVLSGRSSGPTAIPPGPAPETDRRVRRDLAIVFMILAIDLLLTIAIAVT